MNGKTLRLIGMACCLVFLFSAAAQADSQSKRRNTKTVTLSVDGMSCGSCVTKVTNALENLDGVRRADVSLKEKSAVVKFDPEKLDIENLVSAIVNAGYKAEYVDNALLQGIVVDGHTGEPASGVSVSWIFQVYDQENKTMNDVAHYKTSTNTQGKYTFFQVPESQLNQDYIFRIQLDSPDFIPQEMGYRGKIDGETVERNFGLLHKDKNLVYEGRVFNPATNESVNEADVKVIVVEPENNSTLNTFQSKSRADGTYHVEIPARELNNGKNYSKLTVEKPGYSYILFDGIGGRAAGDITENIINFAYVQHAYQLASSNDLVTVKGIVTDEEGNALKNTKIDFAGIHLTKTCSRGCCGDPAVHEVESAQTLTTDAEGNFVLQTEAKYLFGLKYGLKVHFDGYEKIYRAVMTKGDSRLSREIESDNGNLLELEFIVGSSY